MTIGTALEFISQNINWVVASSVVVILLLLIPLLWISVKSSPDVEDTQTLKGLEGSLKKMIEETQSGKATLGESAGNSAQVEKEKQELVQLQAELRNQLQQKEKEIETLKSSAGSNGAGASSVGVSAEVEKQLQESEDRVRELEARLREYEIIEDDIADLSTFKEENAKLRQEIQKIKAGVVSPFSQDSVPPTVLSTQSATAEDLIDKTLIDEDSGIPADLAELQAESESDLSVDEPSVDEVAPALITQDDIDALMNQAAEQMVSQEESSVEQMLTEETFKGASANSSQSEDLSIEIERARKNASQPIPQSQQSIGDQLLAELETAVIETEKVNPEKLLSDIENIQMNESEDGKSLDAELNTDLIASEIDQLQKEEPS